MQCWPLARKRFLTGDNVEISWLVQYTNCCSGKLKQETVKANVQTAVAVSRQMTGYVSDGVCKYVNAVLCTIWTQYLIKRT